MALVVNTNVASVNAQRHLARTQFRLNTAMERLSSGERINSARDDAAGMALSELLKSQARSFGQAERNANDGLSYLQTMEGGLSEIHDMLSRMRELSVQSSSGTLTDAQRSNITDEFEQLQSEIDRIGETTLFNGLSGIGSASTDVDFQVGINGGGSGSDDMITYTGIDATSAGLAVDQGTVTVDTAANAQAAITALDTAIASVSRFRATNGAQQNRLLTTVNNIQNIKENLLSANSRIRDADVAAETSELTRMQILTQAGASVLGNANQLPQIALGLLQ